MRRQIQSVPTELPNVRLYLDDLETITKIISDEMISSPPIAQSPPRVVYGIGNVEMDSIDDLLDQGGSVKNLTVTVSNAERPFLSSEIRYRSYDSPALTLYAFDQAKRWHVYAQILDVCNKRRMVLKEFVGTIPHWLALSAWWAMCLLPIAMSVTTGWTSRILSGITLIVMPLTVVGVIAFVRPTRVYLVRSHEKDKIAAEGRKKYKDLILTLILGGIVAELIRYFGGKLLK